MSPPQRRFTSVFDLVRNQVGTDCLDLKFPGTSPVYCRQTVWFPYSKSIDHKTLLAVTNAVVEPFPILTAQFQIRMANPDRFSFLPACIPRRICSTQENLSITYQKPEYPNNKISLREVVGGLYRSDEADSTKVP